MDDASRYTYYMHGGGRVCANTGAKKVCIVLKIEIANAGKVWYHTNMVREL